MSREKEKKKIEQAGGREKLSRRQFIKDAGTMIGGAAVASLALASACGGEPATTGNPQTGVSSTTATTNTSTTKPPATTTTQATTGVTATKEPIYIPATTNPPLEDTVGCTSKVALGRLYSIEHTWVMSLTDKLVVLGISDKFQLLMGMVERGELYIMPVGTRLEKGDFLANMEGQKMNVDVITPVSGTIVQVNDDLYIHSDWIESEPYLRGYLVVMELSNPAELNDLIDPITYAKLQAKKD